MTDSLSRRFLEVDESAPPWRWLGLASAVEQENLGLTDIDAALAFRIEQVRRHAEGRSPAAQQCIDLLNQAAADLKRDLSRIREVQLARPVDPRLPRPPRRPDLSSVYTSSAPQTSGKLPSLTAFDRQVLAVLVGSGGWNASSRSRLVALAGAYRISTEGLMKVIRGLSRYSHAAGPKLDVRMITAKSELDETMVDNLPLVPVRGQPQMAERIDRFIRENMLGDGKDLSVFKLSLVFGSITILLVTVVVIALLTGKDPLPSGKESALANLPRERATNPPTPAASPRSRKSSVRRTGFVQMPRFLGNGLPLPATEAADECPTLPGALDALARKLEISDQPSESLYQLWEEYLNTAATGWMLVDNRTRNALTLSAEQVLIQAEELPGVSDRLLAGLVPHFSRHSEPVEVWRSVWRCGMLGRMTDERGQSPALQRRARLMLQEVLSGQSLAKVGDFETAGRAWLGLILPELVSGLEIDDNSYDAWELWVSAQRELGSGAGRARAYLSAVEAILRTGTDLGRLSRRGERTPAADNRGNNRGGKEYLVEASVSTNVLGRLILELDLETDAEALEQIAAFFNDEEITARDLWVLTSMFVQYGGISWFEESLILPDDADSPRRRRMRDRIIHKFQLHLAELPDRAGRGGHAFAVDLTLLTRWIAVADELLSTPRPGEHTLVLGRLVIAARLNETARLLAAGDDINSPSLLDELEQLGELEFSPGLNPTGANLSPGGPGGATTGSRFGGLGQTMGTDGKWADDYRAVKKNASEKIERLNRLGRGAGTDLGPIDAAVFVEEVYGASPSEVRLAAQEILLGRFGSGPTVALEMLNQYRGGGSQSVAITIEQLTGSTLPTGDSQVRKVATRLALVEHALSLRHSETDRLRDEIDSLVEELAEAYRSRTAMVRGQVRDELAPLPAEESARRLQQAGREEAANRGGRGLANDPVPRPLHELHRRDLSRRRMARGPIQQFIAAQLAVLDLLAYVAGAEQPGQREDIKTLLAESIRGRERITNGLEQALAIEETMAAVWRLRFQFATPTASRRLPPPTPGGSLSMISGGGKSGLGVLLLAVSPAGLNLQGSSSSDDYPGVYLWAERLELLTPGHPEQYFELGEEIADTLSGEAGGSSGGRELARHLFELAGALDRDRFGRSAALALADLLDSEKSIEEMMEKRRLLALARLRDERPYGDRLHLNQSSKAGESGDRVGGALALSEAFAFNRMGRGKRALSELKKGGAEILLDRFDHLIPGGRIRFLENCRLYQRGKLRPPLPDRDISDMLHLERILLAGEAGSWSDVLYLDGALTGSTPGFSGGFSGGGAEGLIEVDPDNLAEAFGVDVTRPYWREGEWRGMDQGPSR